MEHKVKYKYGENPHAVKIDGRLYYTKCPRCGGDKSLRTPYCKICQKERRKEPKKIKVEGAKVKLEAILSDVVIKENELIQFYERLEKRDFWCSDYELYVDLITLFNFFGSGNGIDTLPPMMQLQYMWEVLKRKYKVIKSKPTKIKRVNGAKRKKRRSFYQDTQSRNDEREYNL